jgi:outer membrane protein TolC
VNFLRLRNDSAAAYQEALNLTTNRFQGGIASQVDVEQAKTVLETTQAQAQDATPL